ncbi:MAG: hypothetical protein JWM35_2152 [Verrucomicrobia bacterium]|nr:hypothetical protein [Verrucomicrobiota bacterium]
MKNPIFPIAAGLLLLFTAACSTPRSRISSNQSQFDTWPADIREKVRAGHVEVGFDMPMVRMALGEPDRRFTRTTNRGTSEVWGYFDHGPKFSFGIGVGSSHRGSAVGGAVAVGDDGFTDEEVMRVIFESGRVAAVETRQK